MNELITAIECIKNAKTLLAHLSRQEDAEDKMDLSIEIIQSYISRNTLSTGNAGKSVKNIPIAAAKRISADYGLPEVVIFAYDPASGDQHVTTFGKTLEQCKDAARAGNYLKKALGWPDELCHSEPARAKRQRERKNERQ